MASEQEERRIAKLEQRALEAESTIVQMKGYIELLTQRAGQGSGVEKVGESKSLLEENARLQEEVEQLKRKLVELETLRGIVQVPLPVVCQPAPEKSGEAETKTSLPKEVSPSLLKVVKEKAKSQDVKPKENASKGGKGTNAEVDVSRLDMRVGKIVDVKRHPDADTLYVEQIDVGEEQPRTILSGLVEHYSLEEMQGRIAIVMCNLKPVKMRGIFSCGMVMCASTKTHCEFIDPPPGSVPGDRIIFDKYPGVPDEQLNPKKKVWERIKPDLHTDENRVAMYKDDPFKVEGKGICTAPTLANVNIT